MITISCVPPSSKHMSNGKQTRQQFALQLRLCRLPVQIMSVLSIRQGDIREKASDKCKNLGVLMCAEVKRYRTPSLCSMDKGIHIN